jgi:hypothetical protein
MKRLLLALAAAGCAAAAGADSVYHGFAEGSPDLYSGASGGTGVTASPPAIGGDVDRYQGIEQGNPDLFGPYPSTAARDEPADVYHGIEKGNPDLR